MKLSDDDTQEQVRRALFELADSMVIDDTVLAGGSSASRPSISSAGHRPARLVLVAASLLLVGGGSAALSVRLLQAPTPRVVPGTQVVPGTVVDTTGPTTSVLAGATQVVVGNVADFPPDSVIPVPQYGLFIANDPAQGLLAFSRGLKQPGCEIERMSDYGTAASHLVPVFPVPPGSRFINPCSTVEYSIGGLVLRGGANFRGLYRYALEIHSGQVLVDLSLAIPGPRFDGSPDPDGLVGRRGPTDERAVAWRNVVQTQSVGHYNVNSGLPIEVLGAFDDVHGVVSVALVFDEYVGELQVLPAGAAPLVTAGRTVLLDTLTTSGRIVVVGPADGDRAMHAELTLQDGRRLRLVLGGAPAALSPSPDGVSSALDSVAARAAVVGAT